MTLWVTGMAGFIGQAIARSALSDGIAVAGIGLIAAPVPPEILKYLVAAPIGQTGLAQLLAQFGPPSAIIHAAGSGSVGSSLADPSADYAANVTTTEGLCEFLRCQRISAPLVLVSSAAVYGAGHDGPIDNFAESKPVSPYGFNKLIAEALVRSYAENFGQPAAIVRLFSVYGEGLRKQVLWDICNQFDVDGTAKLSGTGNSIRDFLHVEDAAAVLRLGAQLADTTVPVINGGTGVATSTMEMAEVVGRAWKFANGREVSTEFSGVTRAGDPMSLVADNMLARAHGFVPKVTFEDGAARYVSWFVRERVRSK